MLQFPQGFSFNLPNTLAGHAELLPDFLQRVICVVLAGAPHWLRALHHADAEAHAEHALFAEHRGRQTA